MNKLLNYSTKISPEQTIAEIQQSLSAHGVKAMMTEYDGKQVSAVSFQMDIDGRLFPFKMPCNWRGVFEILNTSEYRTEHRTEEQAIRTAWRILLVWIKAQLALVEVNMVTIPQVFLPYTIMFDGKTLAEKVEEDPSYLLSSLNPPRQ